MPTASASKPTPGLGDNAAEHAVRGAAIHVRLRMVLAVFGAVTVWWAPPACYGPDWAFKTAPMTPQELAGHTG